MSEVAIKQLNSRNKWEGVPLEKLLGRSILDYILDCPSPIAACLTVQEQKLFVGNDLTHLESYREKGIVMAAADLKRLFDKEISHPTLTIVTEVFPDAQFSCYTKKD